MRRLLTVIVLVMSIALPTVATMAAADPTAILDAVPREPDVDELVSFDASRSTPGTGASDLEFNFMSGDGAESGWQSAGVWQYAYPAKGSYTATVMVRNEHEELSQDTVRVEVGKTDEALLFGLSAMALILVIVILAMALGMFVLLVRKRRKASEPYRDPYIDENWSASFGEEEAVEETTEGRYGGYEGEGADAADFMEGPGPEDVFTDEAPEPVRPTRPARAGAQRSPAGGPAARQAGAVRPRRASTSGAYRTPAADVERVEETGYAAEPAAPLRPKPVSQKSLIVDCPNCGNEMRITYTEPPVYLTCERCGMKGEVPEEMLG
ncbi:MAG: PKD domain-containing protein [Thermoplasmata archaeon]|nr:PKD domain-containing protein [Thermoplasmata archaeon]